MNKKEFKQVMAILFSAYQKAPDKVLSDTYFVLLKNYLIEDLREAVVNHIKVDKWFPSVSQLIDMMFPIECTEVECRTDIINAASDGKMEKLVYDISRQIVRELGWFNCGQMSPSDLGNAIHYRYKDVADHWMACKTQGREFTLPGARTSKKLASTGFKPLRECLTMESAQSEHSDSTEYSPIALPKGKKGEGK